MKQPVLLGAICGDVIGSIYESRRHSTKNYHFELFTPYARPTDDTVLTAAVADWLLHDKWHSANALTFTMVRYANKYPNAGFGRSFREWMVGEEHKPYNSWGNGSAMRVSPVAYYFDTLEEVLEMAKVSAEVTHNHAEGVKGAQATAAAIFMARTGSSKAEIKEYIEREFAYDLHRTLDSIRPSYRFHSNCQESVPESIICFLESKSYEDCIRLAISMGGDADTMAAIAGSIAAAFYKDIPEAIADFALGKLPNDIRAVVEEFQKTIDEHNVNPQLHNTMRHKEKTIIRNYYDLVNNPEQDYLFFWGHHEKEGKITKACFSQWYPAAFQVDGCTYSCMEQYMMACKARVMGDEESLKKIVRSQDPKEMKALGRQIWGFDSDRWDMCKKQIVILGNLAKFVQHKELRDFLLSTGDKVLVEASPYDTIWGIGMSADDPDAKDPDKWEGKNYLGFALMEVREMLKTMNL